MSAKRQPSTGECPTCGKQCYLSKADAKRVTRGIEHRRGRLTAYRCGPYWHVGHLPRAVVTGDQTRDDIVVVKWHGRPARDTRPLPHG